MAPVTQFATHLQARRTLKRPVCRTQPLSIGLKHHEKETMRQRDIVHRRHPIASESLNMPVPKSWPTAPSYHHVTRKTSTTPYYSFKRENNTLWHVGCDGNTYTPLNEPVATFGPVRSSNPLLQAQLLFEQQKRERQQNVRMQPGRFALSNPHALASPRAMASEGRYRDHEWMKRPSPIFN